MAKLKLGSTVGGQEIAIGSDITTLYDRIGTAETNINSNDSAIAGNDSDIATLDSRVDGHDSDIATLDSRVDSNDSEINQIDSNHDGIVDNADNVTSTYKGNDIDTDGDGKVDNADYADNAEYTAKVKSYTSDPATLEDGMLWFRSDLDSRNLLFSTEQVARIIKTFIYYLYNYGVETINFVEGYSEGYGSQSKQSDYLYLSAGQSPDNERTYVTDEAIDITGASTITIEWENTGQNDINNNSYLAVSSSKTGSHASTDAVLHKELIFNKRNDTLDVSGLSGNKYIRVHAEYYNVELKVYLIKIE